MIGSICDELFKPGTTIFPEKAIQKNLHKWIEEISGVVWKNGRRSFARTKR